jgi:hypothetical protein
VLRPEREPGRETSCGRTFLDQPHVNTRMSCERHNTGRRQPSRRPGPAPGLVLAPSSTRPSGRPPPRRNTRFALRLPFDRMACGNRRPESRFAPLIEMVRSSDHFVMNSMLRTSGRTFTLPQNSVGSKQLKNKEVTRAKIAPAAQGALTKAAAQGKSGPQGPPGPQGGSGPQGAQGAPGNQGPKGDQRPRGRRDRERPHSQRRSSHVAALPLHRRPPVTTCARPLLAPSSTRPRTYLR